MKRKWLLLWLVVTVGLTGAWSAEQAKKDEGVGVRSVVSQVIVYPSWAYVTREAEIGVTAGLNQFVFKGLPAWIDEDSIRVRVGGGESLTILGTTTQTTFLSRSTENEVRQAEEAVMQLRDRIEDLKGELASLNEEKKFLQELTAWKLGKSPQEGSARPVAVAELRELKTFIQQELFSNLKKSNQVNRRIREIEPELQAKEKAWQAIRDRGQLEQKDITVELQAKHDLRTTLAVGYLISGASWYPTYDARADSNKGSISFACRAVVQQSTGEDWTGAAFMLSTIQPYLVREKPEILPWYVNPSTVTPESQVLDEPSQATGFRSKSPKGRTEKMMAIQQKQQELSKSNNVAYQAYEQVASNVVRAMEVARLVEERGTTVEFTIPGRHSIRADGKAVDLPIGGAELDAKRRYSAAPAVSRSTYMTGEMRNLADFVFLPGPVRVYLEGSFMGKSEIDCIAQGEKFELYLGLEERIRVNRELDTKKSSTHSAGDRRRLTVAYTIDVKNFLNHPASIDVQDQFPVSQDSSVKVKLLNMEPEVQTVDKGIITWPLTLQPGESRQLRFEFQIDYPAHIFLQNALEIERQLKVQ